MPAVRMHACTEDSFTLEDALLQINPHNPFAILMRTTSCTWPNLVQDTEDVNYLLCDCLQAFLLSLAFLEQ